MEEKLSYVVPYNQQWSNERIKKIKDNEKRRDIEERALRIIFDKEKENIEKYERLNNEVEKKRNQIEGWRDEYSEILKQLIEKIEERRNEKLTMLSELESKLSLVHNIKKYIKEIDLKNFNGLSESALNNLNKIKDEK